MKRYNKATEWLADAVESVVPEGSGIIDLGAGKGSLVSALRERGWEIYGVDISPQERPGIVARRYDLTQDCSRLYEVADWALFFEVGEHVPWLDEQPMLDQVCRIPTSGIIASWAPPGTRYKGHVNCRPREYVVAEFAKRNWILDPAATETANEFRRGRRPARRHLLVLRKEDKND